MPVRGLIADIFKSETIPQVGDRLSNRYAEVFLLHGEGPVQGELIALGSDVCVRVGNRHYPAVTLQENIIIKAKPLDVTEFRLGKVKVAYSAMGGSFIYSSDSRFRAISDYPIPLHDHPTSN